MRLDFLDNQAKYFKLGNNLITYDTVQPANPVTGDLWYEPGAQYPQPWEWDGANAVWLSGTIPVPFGRQSIATETIIDYPIEFYGVTANKIKILSFRGIIRAVGTQTSTSYWSQSLIYFLGTGSYAFFHAIPENTGTNPSVLAVGGVRRINTIINQFLPGNAWSLSLRTFVTGSPGQIDFNSACYVKFARA